MDIAVRSDPCRLCLSGRSGRLGQDSEHSLQLRHALLSGNVADMNMQTDKTSVPSTATAVDIRRILQMIPHRYPMLMVDKVIELRLDPSAVGTRNGSSNTTFF